MAVGNSASNSLQETPSRSLPIDPKLLNTNSTLLVSDGGNGDLDSQLMAGTQAIHTEAAQPILFQSIKQVMPARFVEERKNACARYAHEKAQVTALQWQAAVHKQQIVVELWKVCGGSC